jgi:aminopeptidase-like protein
MNLATISDDIYHFIEKLYPICRSITGNGVRETLSHIKEMIPLEIHEVPTGTSVYDWTIPKEWNIRDAHIKDSSGKKIVDFKNSNLHVVNYSIPIKKTMPLSELKEHIFTIPDKPQWIPYRTSYYKETWGFCMPHSQFEKLLDGQYEVFIDSTLDDGYLTYGEYLIKGETEDEVLFSTHVCHPSLCNDNLSGISLAVHLAEQLKRRPKLRYSYRFLFIPGTIGSITWLHHNEAQLSKIKHGLVVTLVGDSGQMTYKKSRQGNAEVDRAVEKALRDSGDAHKIVDFIPYGYDERQYCSPGFDLPVGCLMRTPHGQFPQYHTSADDLKFISPKYLANSFKILNDVIEILENNQKFVNTNPKCEPQLGKRGIYNTIGGRNDRNALQIAILWVLNLSDSHNDLLSIAERSGVKFSLIKEAANLLQSHDLIEKIQ